MKAALLSFFTIVTGIWLVLHLYLGIRIVKPLRGWKQIAVGVLVAILAGLPPVVLALGRRGVELPMQDALNWVGLASMGFSTMLVFWFLTEDAVRLGAVVAGRLWPGRRRSPAPEPDPERRRFLRNSLNFGVVGATGGLAAVEAGTAFDAPRVREVAVPIRGLPPALAGFRIAQISDLHVGPTIRREYAETVARVTNALGADMIAVTGDVVDGLPEELRDDVAPLAALSAPMGVYFVTGNHEYYWDTEGWLSEFRGFGWDLLMNEHRILERGGGRILLAGVTDFRSARYVPSHVSSPAAARAGAPAADVSILLAHQPRSIFAAAAASYDLQISGHTHGGQFFPVNLLIHLFEPYVRGLHLHDDTWIFVQSGTGYWGPPNRLGVPKEIALIVLERGD